MARTSWLFASRGKKPIVAYCDGTMASAAYWIASAADTIMLSETGRSGLLDIAYLKEKLCLPGGVFPLMTMVFGYTHTIFSPMPPKLPVDQISFSKKYIETDSAILDDWLEQMRAGYKAGHLNSSFEAQLEVYKSKIGQAEKDLQAMIFNDPTARNE